MMAGQGKESVMNRSSFLASSASMAAFAGGVPGGTHLVERRADFDEAAFRRTFSRPADVRVVVEAVAFHPETLANIKNALNGLEFGFGHAEDRVAIAFAPHGASSAFTYSDEVWQKYKIGDFFKLKDASGAPVTSNVFLKPAKRFGTSSDPDDPDSRYQDTSIETLQSRGVIFMTCHTAVEEQSRALVKAGSAPGGMSAAEVANDILTHLIPGTHVVPSMVAAIIELQQAYRYGYMTLTFA
jgi:intracellular sulfur oxidation DsrE/DsrF family protein